MKNDDNKKNETIKELTRVLSKERLKEPGIVGKSDIMNKQIASNIDELEEKMLKGKYLAKKYKVN